MSDDQNVVYIGRKPVMSYVLAVLTHLNQPDAKDVVLKARGMAIATAVDVAEITKRRFMNTLFVDTIDIGTEDLTGENGRPRGVSFMVLHLKLAQ